MESIVKKIVSLVEERKITKDDAKEMLKELQNPSIQTDPDIAVIGIAGKFPQADNVAEFWDNLIHERNCISIPGKSRRETTDPLIRAVLKKEVTEPAAIYKTGGYINEISCFDAGFFRISPHEAMVMEPAQRLFLQVAWEAVEDAGLGGDHLIGSNTGVFVGRDHSTDSIYKKLLPEMDALVATGSWTGILASRIAYIFDFQGPSVVVDTACSSGLVAIHEACQALRNRECEQAIAGGVFVEIVSTKGNNRLSMVESSDYTIRSFDKNANGTVWGEGVGAVLLKPLKKALADGDPIHAVIRGSAINNDGASNGITAPKAEAQEQVILKAWKNARLDPETLTYVEAHGTGTILGDPIEIKGLTSAFRQYTDKKQFCGIGSCKTNIGHLVGASGVASFIKMVLCVKHGVIPASLNFEEPNPYIDFSDSPLFVNSHLREWTTDGFPRRGGVSAYGFSGTNCHMVLEEPPVPESQTVEGTSIQHSQAGDGMPHLVAISGRNREVLQQFVRRYRQWAAEHPQMNLTDFCYTIQTGRGHFTHRLALIVRNQKELLEKLTYLSEAGVGHEPAANVFYGEHKVVNASKQNREPGELTESERRGISREGAAVLEELARTGLGLEEAARYYVQGAEWDWKVLYAGQKRRRLHLPTYPFEEIRYWPEPDMNLAETKEPAEAGKPVKEIDHPLVDRCIAETINEDIYVTSFGVERHWVLKDHRVLGNYVVPGTTYIELIREVVKKYYPDWGFELSDLYFMTPLMVNEGETREVQTVIQRRDQIMECTVASRDEVSEEWVVHAQGKIQPCQQPAEMKLDLEQLKTRFFHVREIEPREVKGAFELGPHWAHFRRVHMGQNEVLVFIQMQDSFQSELTDFLIHPALMDIAVNAFSQALGDGMYLPFTYKSLRLFGRMPAKFYSYMRKIDKPTESAEMFSANITLTDENGRIFAEISDYKVKKVRVRDLRMKQNLYYRTQWKKVSADEANRRNPATQKVLILHDEVGLGLSLAAQLRAQGSTVFEATFGSGFTAAGQGQFTVGGGEDDYTHLFAQLKEQGLTMILHLASLTERTEAPELGDLLEYQKRGVKSLFHISRAMAKTKFKDSVEMVLVTAGVNPVTGSERTAPHQAALVGLGKVVGLEMSNLTLRSIDLEPQLSTGRMDHPEWIPEILQELSAPASVYQVSYRGGQRYEEEIIRYKPDEEPALETAIKSDGVYLITGGTGGIGLEIAKYLTTRGQVNLALLNRTPLPMRSNWNEIIDLAEDERLCRKLKAIRELEANGSAVVTCAANVDSYEEMEKWISGLRQRYGRINGIVHAAGVAGDGFLLRKDEAVFDGVLAPKVQGTWILDRLTRTDRPDFFILCSSIASSMASVGQGDYVAANSYLDAYAAYRTGEGYPTLSINWAAWKETGMAVDYKVNTEGGIFKGLTTMQAIGALDEILAHTVNRVIVGELNYRHDAFADPDRFPIRLADEIKDAALKMRHRLQVTKTLAKTDGKRKEVKMKGNANGEYSDVERDLASIWGQILALDEVDIYEDFYALGGDSIIAIKLTNAIKSIAGIKLDTSDIFAYQTIASLAAYLQQQSAPAAEAAAAQTEEVQETQKVVPLSNSQQRIWFLQQYNPGMTAYNLPTFSQVKGGIQLDILQKVLDTLVQRHSALRTVFVEQDGVPRQIILPKAEIPVEMIDLSMEADPEGALRERIHTGNREVFDLTKPAVKVKVFVTNAESTYIYLNFHHIITDGWSMGIFIQELIQLYYRTVEGAVMTLPPLPVRYEDWLIRQAEWMDSPECREAETYWLQEMKKPLPVLHIPTDYPRPAEKTYNGSYLHRQIDAEQSRRLKEMVREQETTLHMLLLSAYILLLQKLTQDDELIVGVPVAGRDQQELEQVVGLFINMLPIRISFDSLHRFTELLGVVKEKSMRAYKHSKYPFDLLVQQLNPERDPSRSPIFSTVFQFFTLTPASQEGVALYDLSLDCHEADGKIQFKFEYCTDLFTRRTIERLADYFLQVLRQVEAQPEIELAGVRILSETEQRRLLEEFNATDSPYPREKTIHGLFEEQAAHHPERVAVTSGGRQRTYAELNRKANRLAHRLREMGVERDQIVGIMAERSWEMIVGMMGVLKAGGAYMPIDPDYPAERIQYMLADSDARILLTRSESAAPASFTGQVVPLTDEPEASHLSERMDNPAAVNKPYDLAYVMYTSGSTGRPKGVMIAHQSVVNLAAYYNTLFRLEEDKHVLHMSNVSFDTAVVEIFPPLMYGARICVIRKEQALDREELLRVIEAEEIHLAQFVPMTLQEMLGGSPKPACLESVIVGGDKLDDSVKDRILALGYRLTNHYGPTESTVDALVAHCAEGQTTIGKPIANTRIYILGRDSQPVPVGVVGELCISGVGLARGYLNRPDLTAEKFLPNPWVPGERLYRTGDMACWEEDGTVTFHGRMDNQVKIRGYRIEPHEIDEQLLRLDGISHAVVIDRFGSGGEKYLCAYYVAEREWTVTELRNSLAVELPEYMIPSYFVRLEQIPLTYNGKVDRKALPQPEGEIITGVDYVAPVNPMEEKLVELWKEVLGVREIGTRHNFFEMGGHSLKAMTLAAKIQKELRVKIPFSELFKHPTVQSLAAYLAQAEQNPYTAIQPAEAAAYYPLSSAQRRMYIQWQLASHSKAYNMTSALILEGDLDQTKLEQAVQGLTARHEALRTSFAIVDGGPVQYIHPHLAIPIEIQEVEEAQLADRVEDFIRPYDLNRAPLFRIRLLRFAERKHLLLFDLHHIISDGLSMSILNRDFAALYAGQELAPLRIHYKDYAVWHNALMDSPVMERLSRYWTGKLEGFAYTELPADRIAAEDDREGSIRQIRLDRELTRRMRLFCSQRQITPFAFTFGIFNMILREIMQQDDLTVGIPVSGRSQDEMEEMVGVFLNMLPIRTQVDKELTFTDYIAAVSRNLLEAQDHQDYPYEALYARAKELWSFPQHSLFSILFNYMPYSDENGASLEGITLRPYPLKEMEPKYSLTLYVSETGDQIIINAVFQNRLDERLIEILLQSIPAVTETVLRQENMVIKEISLTGEQSAEPYAEDLMMEFDNNELF